MAAAAATAAVLGSPNPTRRHLAQGFLLLGLACVITGLADHMLLARAMRVTRAAGLEPPMPTPFEYLQSLNRLVHEPARLAILVALSACDKADFLFLLNITGLTKGNLSSHLTKLADAGLAAIEKKFEGKTPIAYAKLTLEGKEALTEYWSSMDKARAGIRHLKPLRTT